MDVTNGTGGAGDGVALDRIPGHEELELDDTFLDALSRGDAGAVGAGACGTDAALAALLATSVRDAEPIPAPPALPAGWGAESDQGDGPEDAESVVTPLRASRGDRSAGGGAPRRGIPLPGRMTTALLGAAAASVVIIGGLSAVTSAQPGGALWPLRQQLLGQESVTVELAATLERADAAAGDGDAEEARRLLAYAEQLLAEVDERDRERMNAQFRETSERIRYVVVPGGTTTVTTTSERTATPGTETRTVRETVTEQATVTVTERPVQQAPPAQGGDAGAGAGGGDAAQPPAAEQPLNSSPRVVPAPAASATELPATIAEAIPSAASAAPAGD